MELVYKLRQFTNVLTEIDLANELGFRTVEIEFEESSNRYDIRAISDKIISLNMLSILHINCFLTRIFRYDYLEQASIQEITDFINLYDKLNFIKVGIHIDSLQETWFCKCDFELYLNKLLIINNLCKDKNLILMLENGLNTNFDFLVKHKNDFDDFKFLFDVGHINCKSNDLTFDLYLDNFNNKIEHIHLHDNNGNSDQHMPIGVGNIDMQNLIKKLKKCNFNKTISLEFKSVNDKFYYAYSKQLIENLWKRL